MYINFVVHVSYFIFNSLTCFLQTCSKCNICYFDENLMIAHAALALKDNLHYDLQTNSQFWNLEFLENYEVSLS